MDGNKVRPSVGRQKTWRDYGYPRDLLPMPAQPHAPRTTNPKAAKAQVREVLAQGGGGPVSVMRSDGKRDTILNFIKTPDSLDDVHLPESFINHIIDSKDDHRERFVHYILPSLQDPAEVWLTAVEVRGEIVHRRLFVTAFEDIDIVAVVEEMVLDNEGAWLLWTYYPHERINHVRKGTRLYHRAENEGDK